MNKGTSPASRIELLEQRLHLSIVADWAESDNTAEMARVISSNSSQQRSLHVGGDVDWAQFMLTSPSEVRIETSGATGDTMLSLYGPNNASLYIASDDDSGNGLHALIQRTDLGPGTYYIKVQAYSSTATIDLYTLSLAAEAAVLPDAYEPDNDLATAPILGNSETQSRTLHNASDLDSARFTLSSRSDVLLATDGSGGGTGTVMQLYDAEDNLVFLDLDGSDFSYYRAPLNAGTYRIVVSAWQFAYPLAYTLTLVATPISFTPTPWVIDGTSSDDNIYLEQTGTQYALRRNDTWTYKDVSSVSTISINGYAGDDVITVDSSVVKGVLIYGHDGDDILRGGSANDTMFGNFGRDTLYGFGGADDLKGGLDNDAIYGGIGRDMLFGGDGADAINGDGAADYIEGRGKADSLNGGNGNDTVIAGAGNDFITAISGDDWIYIQDDPSSPFADMVACGQGTTNHIQHDRADLISGPYLRTLD